MSSKRPYEAPVGKGIDRATMLAQKADGNYNITVHEITSDAWKAFYSTTEGKARLRRMQTQNALLEKYYKDRAAGTNPGQTKADVIKFWNNIPFDTDGKVPVRQGP
jgi:hypothetical protein